MALRLSDFEVWHLLRDVSVSRLLAADGCVYVLRSAVTQEILYIGETEDLVQRVFKNYIGGTGGSTTQRIHEQLFARGHIHDVEIAWKPSKDRRSEERLLIYEYRDAHDGHLPPWNLR